MMIEQNDTIDSYGRAAYGQYCGNLFLVYAHIAISSTTLHSVMLRIGHVGRSLFQVWTDSLS